MKASVVHICETNKTFLMTPLPSTGKPPHFFFTADKATINRSTNQALLLGVINKGERIAIPVGAPLVYRYEMEDGDLSVVGGSAVELANNIIDCIIQKLELEESHLTYLAGN